MMSQTHLLIAGAAFAKPNQPLRNAAVLVGAFIPDAAIYFLFVWSKVKGIAEDRVWNELYWQEPWQTYTAAGNSIPLYAALLIIGIIFLRMASGVWRIGLFLTFFAMAALTHVAGDLPVHVTDAHRHFWPFSDWKFISSISYWNEDHHGGTFIILEGIGGLLLTVILFRRFKSAWVRALLGILMAVYVLVPAYFTFMLG